MSSPDADELVILAVRKHRLFLVLSLIPPALLLLAAAAGAAYLGLGSLVGAQPLGGWTQIALYGAAGAGIVAVLWLLLAYREWQNDTLTLTERRIIIRRRVFRIFEQEQAAPLSRIQDIRVVVPSPFASVFGYGDISVATASAQSRLDFRSAPRPNAIKETVFRLQQAALQQEREQRRDEIRRTLEQELR